MTSFCSRASFAGLFGGAVAASLPPQAASLTGQPDMHSCDNNSSMDEELTLALSAQLEDRQEARRRIARSGRILQDRGASDEEGAEQQKPSNMFDSSPYGSTSGTEGQPGQDQLPPSARYWRDRATLNGGRLSLEAHAAKLRERHQVQAELRAWCEEVLEGQQQQQTAQETDEQPSQRPKASAAARRRSELPASLHNQLSGQQQHHHRHHHCHRSHHHSQHRASCIAVIGSAAAAAEHHTQQQDQQQWQQPQQHLEEYTASAAAGGGLFLTPRTTEVFTAELQGQLHSMVDQEVQQRLAQAQWQQGNPAEQQLLVKLQQEHKQLQQQLAEAQQQIARLEVDTFSKAAAAQTQQSAASSISKQQTAKRRTSTAGSSSSNSKAATWQQQKQQQEVLLQPRPGVQVLTIVRSGSNSSADDLEDGSRHQADGSTTAAPAVTGATQVQQQQGQDYSDPAEQQKQQKQQQQQQQQQQPAAQTGPADAPINAQLEHSRSNHTTPRTGSTTRPNTIGAAGTAVGDGGARTANKAAGRRATTTGIASAGNSSSRVAPSRCASTAAQPMSSSRGTAAQKLLSLEQQQALVEQLQHAEQVMQMLHGDLQAALVQQQHLAQQLEQSQDAGEQLRQQHQALQQQQQQQHGHGKSSQPGEDTVSREQHAQVVQQLNDARQQLFDVQQQLTQAREAVALAKLQRIGLQAQLEQEEAGYTAREAELQRCIEQLQQQLEVAVAAQAQGASSAELADQQLHVEGRPPTAATGNLGAGDVLPQAEWQVSTGAAIATEKPNQLRQTSTSSNTMQESRDQAEEEASMQLDNSTATPDQEHTQDSELQLEEQHQVQQQQQLEVQPCLHCKQLEQQVKHLQHLLQHATARPDSAPEPTAAASNTEQDTQDRGLTAASGAAATRRQQAVVRVGQQRHQQQLLTRTWLCPVAPELAALQASIAVGQCCEQQRHLSARECAAAGYASAWHMQGCPGGRSEAGGSSSSSSTAMQPEALMLAGVRKMRPLSYSPGQPASSSMPMDGLIGTALSSRALPQAALRSSRQQAAALSVGAERLLQEGLLAGQIQPQGRQQAFLQLVGDASNSGRGCQVAGTRATSAAIAGGHSGGATAASQLAAQQPVFSAVRWICRSSSPRRTNPRHNTPRSARPASAAVDMCNASMHSSMLPQPSSRPQTARSHHNGRSGDGYMIVGTREPVAAKLAATIDGNMHREVPDVTVYTLSTPAGGRSMLRAGSAPLKSGVVPKLNLSVLRP